MEKTNTPAQVAPERRATDKGMMARLESMEATLADMALRQRATDIQLDAGHRQFEAVHDRCSGIETSLAENTEATKRIDSNTADLVAAFASLRGAFRVLEMIGKLAKPLSYVAVIGGAFASAWVAVKTGGPTK